MATPLFIGDEIDAAAWRLAGVRVWVVAPGEGAHAVEEALAGAWELLLLSASCARELSPELLERFSTTLHPLTLVVPDVTGRASPPDLESMVRARLGMVA
ncbi:MAG: Vacuolar H+transporting two-sector ATPase F subunit [Magnetococcales bacterium]|nr:Vacuolar H+transporting two-sector ATPase F subunit [Magnetococcales bacterium]